MNRPIKFRAWDAGLKVMLSWGIKADGEPRFNGWLSDRIVSRAMMYEPDGLELMQFTGLLDKNGKEIYEGDTVRCLSGQIAEVKYDPDFAEFTLICGSMTISFNRRVCANQEVIGNIYDNPELMKGKQ